MHKTLTGMASNIDTATMNIHGNALHSMYKYYIYVGYLIFFDTESIFPKSFIP